MKMPTGKSKLENRDAQVVERDLTAEPQVSNFQFPVSSFQFRIWLRALTVKRPQAAVAAGSLLVGALVSSTLLNLYSDVRRKMTNEFAAYGPNVVLAPAYVAEPGQRAASAVPAYSAETRQSEWRANLIDESVLTRLEPFRQRISGLAAAPVLYLVVRVERMANSGVSNAGQSADPDNAVAVGTDFAALWRLNPNWRLQGSAKTLERRACAVGAHVAAQLHVVVGDAIQLQTLERAASETKEAWQVFAISNVISTGTSEDDQIFVPLASLQQLAGLARKISLVQLNIPGEAPEIERGIRELSRSLPKVEVRPIRQIVYSEGKVLGTLRWLLASLTALIVTIIGLCVMATMTSILLERRKDIAVMKALGASDRRVMQLFLSEVAALGLLSGVLGSVLGVFLARDLGRRLFGVSLNAATWTLPAVGVATMLLAVLAAFLPIRVVRGIQPATMLKGE